MTVAPRSSQHLLIETQYVKSESKNLDDIVDMATYSGVDIDLRGKTPQITLRPVGRNTAAYSGAPHSTAPRLETGSKSGGLLTWAYEPRAI